MKILLQLPKKLVNPFMTSLLLVYYKLHFIMGKLNLQIEMVKAASVSNQELQTSNFITFLHFIAGVVCCCIHQITIEWLKQRQEHAHNSQHSSEPLIQPQIIFPGNPTFT